MHVCICMYMYVDHEDTYMIHVRVWVRRKGKDKMTANMRTQNAKCVTYHRNAERHLVRTACLSVCLSTKEISKKVGR